MFKIILDKNKTPEEKNKIMERHRHYLNIKKNIKKKELELLQKTNQIKK